MILLDKIQLDKEWKISLFPTKKFSTVSIAVYFYDKLQDSVKFEENTLFFYWFSSLKKKILVEKFGFDVAERFVCSTSLFFNNQLKTYGTRIIHPKYSDCYDQDLENIVDELVNVLIHTKDLTEDLMRKAKQDLIAKIQRQFANPFAYSTARLLETAFQNKRYGTDVFGNIDIYQNLDFSFLRKAEEYLDFLQQQDKHIFILGNLRLNGSTFQKEDRFLHSKPVIVNSNFYETEVRKDSINQTIITLGFSCVNIECFQDYLNMQLIDGMLGKYGHSKLFERLRKKNIAPYHVISRYDMMCNVLLVSVCVPCKYEKQTVDEMIENILRFEIDSAYLEKTKQFFKNEVFYLLDTPEGTVSYLNMIKTFAVSLDDIELELSKITCESLSNFFCDNVEYIGTHVLRGSKIGEI